VVSTLTFAGHVRFSGEGFLSQGIEKYEDGDGTFEWTLFIFTDGDFYSKQKRNPK